MPSAAFLINGSDSPVTVTAGATVTLALLSTSGAGVVEWSIVGGSDSSKTAPTITTSGSPQGASATFTMNTPIGAGGLTWLIQCRINDGRDRDGSEVAAYTATGIVGVAGASGKLPFAVGESFERNATVGIADDLNAMLQQATGTAGATTADYSGTFTTTTATTTVCQSIALNDNTYYQISFAVMARDTGNNQAEWIDSQTWRRLAGGVPTILGGSKGPAPFSEISSSTLSGAWVSFTQSSNNVVLSVITSNTSHVKFDFQIWVIGRALTAAT